MYVYILIKGGADFFEQKYTYDCKPRFGQRNFKAKALENS